MKQKDNRRMTLAVTFIVFALLLYLSIILIEVLYFEQQAEKLALDNAFNKTKERQSVVVAYLSDAEQALEALSTSVFFDAYLEDETSRSDLEEMFLTYAQAQADIMNVRYLDQDGVEQIRVGRLSANGLPALAPQKDSRGISGSDHLEEVLAMAPGQVWFSHIALDHETGQPIPVLKAMLPIVRDGETLGILSVSYFAEGLLSSLTNVPLYDMILCDTEGYVIYHFEQKEGSYEKSWATAENQGYNISQEFPDRYEAILSNAVLETDSLVSRRFEVPVEGGMILILQLRASYIEAESVRTSNEYLIILALVVISSLILTYLIMRVFSRTLLSLDELQKYEYILDNASDGIHILDEQGRLIEYSQSFAANLGYEVQEMQGMSVLDWDVGIEAEALIGMIAAYMENPTTFESRHRKKDGTVIDVQISTKGISLDGRRYLYASQRDITAIKTIQRDLEESQRQWQSAVETIRRQSLIDELTQLQNRKAYNIRGGELLEAYHRYGHGFSLLMMDIDDFKSINDTYGHSIGDKVLEAIGQVLQKTIRKNDYVYRLGGEELAILATSTRTEQAMALAEKVRKAIESEVDVLADRARKVTVSIGVAEVTAEDTMDTLFSRADRAMYIAKEQGKNCVIAGKK